jgi:hypothetical protein
LSLRDSAFTARVQRIDLLLQHRHQPQQVVSSTRCPGPQGKFAQQLLSRLAPQLAFALHALVQAQVLQFVLHPRANDHQLVAMQKQLPQIAVIRHYSIVCAGSAGLKLVNGTGVLSGNTNRLRMF